SSLRENVHFEKRTPLKELRTPVRFTVITPEGRVRDEVILIRWDGFEKWQKNPEKFPEFNTRSLASVGESSSVLGAPKKRWSLGLGTSISFIETEETGS